MAESAPRPRQVTLASVVAGVGASLVLVNIFSVMADWGSASVREEVEDALDGGPLGPAEISVDTALNLLRIMLMVVASGCVAAVVFAVYTIRRHRAARIGLTVLAGGWAVLSLALGLAGLLLAAIAVGCVILLWSAEARTWFAAGTPSRVAAAGAPIPPPPNATSAKGTPTAMSTPPPPDEPEPTTWGTPSDQESSASSPEPKPYSGYGPPPAGGYVPPPPGAMPPPVPAPIVPTSRPGTLTAAGVITVVMSGIAFLATGIMALVFLVSRDTLEDSEDLQQLAIDSDISVSDLVTVIGVMCVVAALFAAAALVLGVLLLQNKRVRVALVVVTSIAIVMSLLAFPLGLLWVLAEVLVIVFLFVGGAGAWFDAQAYAADRARQQH
jgi:hypothetical protein